MKMRFRKVKWYVKGYLVKLGWSMVQNLVFIVFLRLYYVEILCNYFIKIFIFIYVFKKIESIGNIVIFYIQWVYMLSVKKI